MHFSVSHRLVLAVVLAVGSSVDNLAVGITVGVTGHRLQPWVNGVVASCNAAGTLLASIGGSMMGDTTPTLAPLLAGSVFMYLGFSEGRSWWLGEESPLAQLAAQGLVARLAVPMTLNNFAGGVAGGVAGVSPLVAAASVLVASFFLMAGGHSVGRYLDKSLTIDPRIAACAIFVLLGIAQLGSVVMRD